jgi:hypothetical protein
MEEEKSKFFITLLEGQFNSIDSSDKRSVEIFEVNGILKNTLHIA